MGLDVYLYHYDDYENTKKISEKFEEENEKIWGREEDYGKLSDEEKERILDKIKKLKDELGFLSVKTKDGLTISYPPGEVKIESNSNKYPDHMFKVGYFRSSYNDGGIERVVGNLLEGNNGCLHYIFNTDGDSYDFSPDWLLALARVREVLEVLKKKTKDGMFRSSWFGANVFTPVEEYKGITSQKALELFFAEKEKKDKTFDTYGCKAGEFFFGGEGLKVRAIIPACNSLGTLGVQVVFEDNQNNIDWYTQALEIVEETIQYVLSQPDPQKFYLHWSS